MAKNNPTEKQTDVETQALLKRENSRKSVKFIVTKLQRLHPNIRSSHMEVPGSHFHLDYLLLLLKFPLLTLNMNNKCCSSNP